MINMAFVFFLTASTGFAKDFAQTECPVVGNTKSRIFHVKGCPNYVQMLEQNKEYDNRKCFNTRQEAIEDGYRIARNCKKEVYRKRYN